MKAIGIFLVIEEIKEKPTKTKGGLLLTDKIKEDIRYRKGIIKSAGDLVNGLKAGETIFYDHKLDAQRIVTPKPGRVVMFDGRIPHTGRPPTPRYMMNRYILTFKYMEPSIRQGLFTKYDVKNTKPVEDEGILGFDPKTVKDILLT